MIDYALFMGRVSKLFESVCDCGQEMKRIGEDVTEKLDYQPVVFSVERHLRGKWVCLL